jgi:hypothetical protein
MNIPDAKLMPCAECFCEATDRPLEVARRQVCFCRCHRGVETKKTSMRNE